MADDNEPNSDAFDYKATQDQLMLVAHFLADLDLKRFIEVADRSETIAPFLDPTLFIRGGRQLQLIKRLAQAARPLQEAFEKFKAEYPKAEWDRIQGDLARGMPVREAMDGGRTP